MTTSILVQCTQFGDLLKSGTEPGVVMGTKAVNRNVFQAVPAAVSRFWFVQREDRNMKYDKTALVSLLEDEWKGTIRNLEWCLEVFVLFINCIKIWAWYDCCSLTIVCLSLGSKALKREGFPVQRVAYTHLGFGLVINNRVNIALAREQEKCRGLLGQSKTSLFYKITFNKCIWSASLLSGQAKWSSSEAHWCKSICLADMNTLLHFSNILFLLTFGTWLAQFDLLLT